MGRHDHGDRSSRRDNDDDEASSEQDRRRRDKKRRHNDDDDDDHRRERKRGHKKHRRDEEADEDRKSRKHRRREDSDDEERKSRKHRRKDASDDDRKSRKHRKKSRRSDTGDESRKKDKKKKKERSERSAPKKSLISLGEPLGKPPAKLLDPEVDYFAYHEHLWVFLFRERGLAFNDMTSEETREAFRDFVKQYNRGDLAEGYYVEKLPAAVMEESKTTKHSWSFRISETEGKSLHSVEAGVRKQTEYRDPEVSSAPSASAPRGPEKHADRSREEVAQERAANRRLKDHVRTAEEEFSGGRKEGRERQIEKRREVGARTHGAALDREGGPEVGDDVLYGGDDRQQFARQKERAAQRQESNEKRLTELQAKERERQEAMFKQLGLTNVKPGEKITIKPRNDG